MRSRDAGRGQESSEKAVGAGWREDDGCFTESPESFSPAGGAFTARPEPFSSDRVVLAESPAFVSLLSVDVPAVSDLASVSDFSFVSESADFAPEGRIVHRRGCQFLSSLLRHARGRRRGLLIDGTRVRGSESRRTHLLGVADGLFGRVAALHGDLHFAADGVALPVGAVLEAERCASARESAGSGQMRLLVGAHLGVASFQFGDLFLLFLREFATPGVLAPGAFLAALGRFARLRILVGFRCGTRCFRFRGHPFLRGILHSFIRRPPQERRCFALLPGEKAVRGQRRAGRGLESIDERPRLVRRIGTARVDREHPPPGNAKYGNVRGDGCDRCDAHIR